jgi:hypothetical protein
MPPRNLLRQARLYLGLGLVKLGARVAGTEFPEAGDEPVGVSAGVPAVPATIGEEGRRMLEDGRRRATRRPVEPPPPPLRGSARDQREQAARRQGRA